MIFRTQHGLPDDVLWCCWPWCCCCYHDFFYRFSRSLYFRVVCQCKRLGLNITMAMGFLSGWCWSHDVVLDPSGDFNVISVPIIFIFDWKWHCWYIQPQPIVLLLKSFYCFVLPPPTISSILIWREGFKNNSSR